MRVIAGSAKGRRLKSVKGRDVRPTSGRVKEALFNILPHDLSGLKVLDLFAGTGNLSAEALSRGAAEAVLIDASSEAAKAIRQNLRSLGLSHRSKVWITPILRALRLLSRRGETFDLVLLDPPYERNWVGKTLRAVAQQGLLRETGVMVAEHSVREKVEGSYGPLTLRDQRRYGTTLISFFAYNQNKDS